MTFIDACFKRPTKHTPILKMHAPELPELLTKFGLKSKTYIVVHPGMAGSALNWSVDQYIAQLKILIKSHPIVVTGTAMDRKWTQGLKKEFRQGELCFLDEQLDPGQLLYVLAHAKHVICPSTGIAHLAASLGTPVTGIYSPIRVHLSRRWGPRGQSDIRILAPNVTCPEAHQCAGKACSYYNCMDGVAAVHTLDVKSAQG
jgi:ADP-heptose:LPS heptosyltransferase